MSETDSTRSAIPPSLERRVFLGLVGVVIVLFLVLLRVTWLKWGDPIVDTGREFEIPWKVSRGEVLYRDMAYNYGPFSPYWNALFLRGFGVHVSSLVASGIVSAVVGVVLVFATARLFLPRIAAVAVVGVFLFESVFQHYFINGNFNFILPYSFPAVHGMLFALAAFLALARHTRRGGRGVLAGAGVLVAFAFLCKIEIAAAILVPLAVVPVLRRVRRGEGWWRAAGDTAAWAGPFAVAVVAGFLPFVLASSLSEVVRDNVLKPQLVDFGASVYFLERLGVEGFTENLWKVGKGLGLWAVLVVAIAGGGNLFAQGAAAGGRVSPGRTAILGWATLVAAWFLLPADLEFRGLQVVALVLAVTALRRMLRRGRGFDDGAARLFALAVFALLCLARILFTVGTFHYGFCLAVPGVILFAVLLGREVPRWSGALLRDPRSYRLVVLALLPILSGRNFVRHTLPQLALENVELTGPGGTLHVRPAPLGSELVQVMAHLADHAGGNDTLVVLPEGAMVNFLARQRNPLHYDLFTPPELNGPGVEAAVIAQLEETRADRVLVVGRSVAEFGYRGLGLDYGLSLMGFVREHYDVEAAFGAPPFGDEEGGCVVYRRRR